MRNLSHSVLELGPCNLESYSTAKCPLFVENHVANYRFEREFSATLQHLCNLELHSSKSQMEIRKDMNMVYLEFTYSLSSSTSFHVAELNLIDRHLNSVD